MDITPSKVQTLEIRIEGAGVHHVPLPSHMTPEDTKALNEAVKTGASEDRVIWTIDYFKKYLGDDINLLTMDDLGRIIEVWNNSTPSAGE